MFGADGSNADATLNAEKELIKKVIEKFDIGPSAILVGSVLYESTPDLVFQLGDYVTRQQLKRGIDGRRRSRRGGDVIKGLEMVRDQLFNERYGARRNVPKTLIVFVDKRLRSESEVKQAVRLARDLREKGVKITAIGIGSEVDKKLLTSLTNDKIFHPPTLESVDDVLTGVSEASKPGKERCLLSSYQAACELEGVWSMQRF